MYDFYINGMLLPVTPGKLEIGYKGREKSIDLINDGEITIPKSSKSAEISFEALLPNRKYPFARYPEGFQDGAAYGALLKTLMESGNPFRFILVRRLPSGKNAGGINLRMILEELKLKEDAENGGDVTASLKLKEYREYGTKTVLLTIDQRIMLSKGERQQDSAPQAQGSSYTVQKGDSLWKIARHFYGNGSDYKKIYDANAGSIRNPNLIYPGQVLVIP